VKEVQKPGTKTTIKGQVPSEKEAIDLINEAGGKVQRIEPAHGPGSVSSHDYPHINYTTPSGEKATIRIQEGG
jgi:hypothetical protein